MLSLIDNRAAYQCGSGNLIYRNSLEFLVVLGQVTATGDAVNPSMEASRRRPAAEIPVSVTRPKTENHLRLV